MTRNIKLSSRVECWHFLIGQNRSSNQRSGMILELQIQNFRASRRTRVKVLIFKKFQGAQLLKLAWSFLLQKRTNAEIKFWNLSLKNYYFEPPKKRVTCTCISNVYATHVCMYGSSCNSMFLHHLFCLLFLFNCIPWAWWNANKRKKKKIWETGTKKRKLHELPYTEIVLCWARRAKIILINN